jgi:hypothetical protein
MYASLLVPQTGPFLFQSRPSPHNMHILALLGISKVCFMYLAPGRRILFQDPLHLRDLYLRLLFPEPTFYRQSHLIGWFGLPRVNPVSTTKTKPPLPRMVTIAMYRQCFLGPKMANAPHTNATMHNPKHIRYKSMFRSGS